MFKKVTTWIINQLLGKKNIYLINSYNGLALF